MKPYPFASLNHFTCPCGILRPRFTGGLQAPVCSRRAGGVCPPTLEGKEKRRADSGRAAYQSVLADSQTPRGRPERRAECHTVRIKSTENPRFGPGRPVVGARPATMATENWPGDTENWPGSTPVRQDHENPILSSGSPNLLNPRQYWCFDLSPAPALLR